jgi:chromosome segregation ATPase
MAFLDGERIVNDLTSSKSTIRDIQTEHLVYQISSSAEIKKTTDKLKKDIDSMIQAMENSRKTAYEKKLASDELKIKLVEKKESVKKIQQELEHTRANITLITKKILEIEKETDKIKKALEKIKESTQDLDPKYFERIKNDLMVSLVKLVSETEKSQSDLRAAKEMELIVASKFQTTKTDFDQSESYANDKTSDADRIISNVSMTISHIVKSHDEVTNAAIDLLKSATTTYEPELYESRHNYTRQEIAI